MEINVNQKGIVKFLTFVFLILLIANLCVIILGYNGYLMSGFGDKFFQKFNFNQENNFPSYFNTILLFIPANILLIIFLLKGNDKLKVYWLILSVVFFFLSLDENIAIHESFSRITKDIGVGGTGIFKFAWIIPYGIFVLVGLLFFYKFLLSLPKVFLLGFLFSGSIYICGTIILESVSGEIMIHYGRTHIYYLLTTTVEESFEMVGLIIFINYLLRYVKFVTNSIQLNIK